MPWHVAHLFEHYVIRQYETTLSQAGINPLLFGWPSAETFRECIYFEVGHYHKASATELRKFLRNVPSPSPEAVAYHIKAIEAEDKIAITVADNTLLRAQLDQLCLRAWCDLSAERAQTYRSVMPRQKSPLIIRSNKRGFSNVTLAVGSTEFTNEEKILALRLLVVVTDLAIEALHSNYSCYITDISSARGYKNYLGFTMSVTLPRGEDAKTIPKQLLSFIQAFDIGKAMPAIEQHFKVFKNEPLWRGLPIEYFRTAHIATSVKEIAFMLNQERVESIFAKLIVEMDKE